MIRHVNGEELFAEQVTKIFFAINYFCCLQQFEILCYITLTVESINGVNLNQPITIVVMQAQTTEKCMLLSDAYIFPQNTHNIFQKKYEFYWNIFDIQCTFRKIKKLSILQSKNQTVLELTHTLSLHFQDNIV